MTARAPCPICKAPSAPRKENASFPFCSARCKMVDLGQWLDEKYRVPVVDSSGDDETVHEKQEKA